MYHTNDFIYYHVLTQQTRDWLVSSHWQYVISVSVNGIPAVSYFFVLSGFVLSYSHFKNNSTINPGSFATKRAFRIFPLYIVVVALGIITYNKSMPDAWTLAKELSLVTDVHPIIPPGWSLTIEFFCSLFVPFLILLIQKKYGWFIALLLFAFFASGYITPYIVHFMLGILLARLFSAGQAEKLKVTGSKAVVFLFVGTCFYLFEPIVKVFLTFVAGMNDVLSIIGISVYQIYPWSAAIGSAIFLFLLLQNDTAKKILRHRVLVFMGRISFGLYLIHWIFIYYLSAWYISPFMSLPIIWQYLSLNLFVLILTSLLATLLHYTVELPFIGIGKTLVKKIDGYRYL